MTDILPRHIAIIMDGNRRWAKAHGLAVSEGHAKGAETLLEILETARAHGVTIMTVFGFSSENWRRPDDEVQFLFKLTLDNLLSRQKSILDEDMRFRVLGSREGLNEELIDAINQTEDLTKHCQKFQFNLAFNYGGRWDIVQACQALAREVKTGALNPEDITDEKLSAHLTTQNLPDPDLLIRTSGEQRLSNFLLWNLAYTELVFTTCHWPDFSKNELVSAIETYTNRKRRYGA